ncbi:MAG: histidine kinase [Solirubrobacteraceae bacterium]|jgi:signal transduction histidine kinase
MRSVTAPSRIISTCSPGARDAVVAALAFAGTVALLHFRASGGDALDIVLAALTAAPLLARRRAPLSAFAVSTAASAVLNALHYDLGPPFGPTFALFFVAADARTRDRMRLTTAVVVGMFAVHVAAAASGHSGFPASPVLLGTLIWGGAWVIGDGMRQRRQRMADLVERAIRAERETERERRLAAAEERTRIARDLHDSAAHAINVILVQAGAARLLQDRDPQRARQSLTTIEDVARETIGEIDRMIRGLRESDAGDAAVEPPAGLAALSTLADRHGANGLSVRLAVDGDPRPLAPALDQAAYRILQESLTNAARHGNGAAEVDIAYRPAQLELTVSNPARPAPAVRAGNGAHTGFGGHGILGMRERAALLGGNLETGVSAGRFRVHAQLPYATVADGG